MNRTSEDTSTIHWKTLSYPLVKETIVKNFGALALAGATESIEATWMSSDDECLMETAVEKEEAPKNVEEDSESIVSEEDIEPVATIVGKEEEEEEEESPPSPEKTTPSVKSPRTPRLFSGAISNLDRVLDAHSQNLLDII